MDLLAASFACMGYEPIKKHASNTVGTLVGIGNEIIHIAIPSPAQPLGISKSSDSTNPGILLQIGKAIAIGLLAPDS